MVSKRKLIESIIDYVFKTYCDDEQIAIFAKDYYAIEKRAEERKSIKISKCHNKTYKITQPVRDFLEPLIDAEYFKHNNYEWAPNPEVLYEAMEQLETKEYNKLSKKITMGFGE